MPSSKVALEAINLSRQFGGFKAVDGVNIQVVEGTIHGLIGPNGAGKTTCFNLLTKVLQPSEGRIILDGKDITNVSPSAVSRLGLVRSFQISSVFPKLSVIENVRIALQRTRPTNLDFWRSQRVLDTLDVRAREILAEVGLADRVNMEVGSLPYGIKRAVELATTLALDPKVMLLDEPTAGMGHEEIDRIVELIRRVRQGRTIVMVEHNLSVVSGLCDRITVLARGKVLAEGDYAAVSTHPAVISAYLGTSHA